MGKDLLSNTTLRSLSEEEKVFLSALKDEPKTVRQLAEMGLGAGGRQDVARTACAKLGLALFGKTLLTEAEVALLPTEALVALQTAPTRWHLTIEGSRALFWGYIKPHLAAPRRRASPGTPAARKRAIARRKRV